MDILIETDRLLIRPFNLDDILPAYEMNLDPAVSKFTGDGGIVSLKETERRIVEDVMGDYQKHGFGRFAVELKGEKGFIGFTGLKFLDDFNEVDIGFRFMKKYWGNGIATESAKACLKYGFETLKMEKIIGLVLPGNIASIRVLEKLNFKFEKEIIEDSLSVRYYSLLGNHPMNF